jgi:hypothetical protein
MSRDTGGTGDLPVELAQERLDRRGAVRAHVGDECVPPSDHGVIVHPEPQ